MKTTLIRWTHSDWFESESFSPRLSFDVQLEDGGNSIATYEEGMWVAADGSYLDNVRKWRLRAIEAVHI